MIIFHYKGRFFWVKGLIIKTLVQSIIIPGKSFTNISEKVPLQSSKRYGSAKNVNKQTYFPFHTFMRIKNIQFLDWYNMVNNNKKIHK